MPKTIKINETSLQAAVIEYIEARDRLQCHIHLRIKPDGECYVSEDAGYSISADEYNNEPDAEKTIRHQQGWGQHHLPEDWQQTEQSMEITSVIGYIVEDLTLDGYDIKWIPPAPTKEQIYDQQIHPLVQQIRKLTIQHNIPHFMLFGLDAQGNTAMSHDQRDECEPPEIMITITKLFLMVSTAGQDLAPTDPQRN